MTSPSSGLRGAGPPRRGERGLPRRARCPGEPAGRGARIDPRSGPPTGSVELPLGLRRPGAEERTAGQAERRCDRPRRDPRRRRTGTWPPRLARRRRRAARLRIADPAGGRPRTRSARWPHESAVEPREWRGSAGARRVTRARCRTPSRPRDRPRHLPVISLAFVSRRPGGHMTFVGSRTGLLVAAALVMVGACSNTSGLPGSGAAGGGAQGSAGSTGSPGTAGTTTSGTAGTTTSGAAGDGPQAGTSGSAGASGAAGSGAGTAGVGGTAGSSGAAGAGGSVGTAGVGGSVGTAGASGTKGTAGAGGSAGTAGAGGSDPPPPRPINVTPGPRFSTSFNGQPMSVNKSKPILGKLLLFLPGIGNGPGSGGIDAFANLYGFHIFMPKTQTNLTGSNVPGMYKGMDTPEANRQVGDARTDLWDGKGRVTWNSVPAGSSMLEETLAAIKYGMMVDPGGDWGFFLNADGTLRTTDVWVIGY